MQTPSLLRVLISVIAALALYSPDTSLAQTSSTDPNPQAKFELSSDVSLTSSYVWRGFADYSGASLQNTVRVSRGPFTAALWTEVGNEPLSGLLVREDDVDLHYTKAIRGTTLTAGYTAYFCWFGNSNAHELYISASRGKRWVRSIGLYQSVGNLTGTYLSAALSREVRVSHNWTAQFNGALGLNRRMYIPETSLSDLTISATFSRPAGAYSRVSPTIGFSKSLNDRYFVNRLYAGILFSISSPKE